MYVNKYKKRIIEIKIIVIAVIMIIMIIIIIIIITIIIIATVISIIIDWQEEIDKHEKDKIYK